ncbi:MAG: (4Fe-4S)-binding protein [Phycisphaerae bacterium]|nr:(4Fe-4S)-binding protein [Phycisphaerae bacterium]
MDAELTMKVKDAARGAGADLVGIASLDRFEGAPKQWDPRYIFPDAKALITLAFRIPRGVYRGAEEGTHFWQYPALGYANINEVAAPMALRGLMIYLEDLGYEAAGIRNCGDTGPWSCISFQGDGLAGDKKIGDGGWFGRVSHTRPVKPDLPAPDVQFHFRIAAYLSGLGEIGFSKIFLTPQFGPRQRFAFCLTDAPLVADPIYDGPPICDRCMACVKECPGALSATETVKVTVAGRELEWSRLDEGQCWMAYASGLSEVNPFLPPDALKDIPDGEKIMKGEKKVTIAEAFEVLKRVREHYPMVPPNSYYPAMCNGRGCMRACMVHLEQKGRLENKFHEKFRKKTPWWHGK